MPVTSWSTTPSSNNAAPPNGWPENMAAAAVNDTARQMMADLVVEFQRNPVKVLGSVAGTNTVTASMTPALTAYSAGMIVVFTPAGNNTGATTLNINSLGALDVQKADGDALVSGDLVSGIPAVLVLDSGADDWILLNPQTLSVTAVSATGAVTGASVTATGAVSGGSLSVTGAATINGALTTDNTTADEVGFKGLPQNSQVGNYTLVLTDAGKQIAMNGTTITLTIPANASVAFPVGTCIGIVNLNSSNLSIAITTDSLIIAATSTTGTRTLSQNGVASIIKVASTTWFITGSGIS